MIQVHISYYPLVRIMTDLTHVRREEDVGHNPCRDDNSCASSRHDIDETKYKHDMLRIYSTRTQPRLV